MLWRVDLIFMSLGFISSAIATEINLPAETAVYRPSDLAGYQLVQQNCIVCHSAELNPFGPF